MTMSIGLDKVILFSLIFVRVSSIMMTAPLFGSESIPLRVRLSLSLILTVIFFPLAGERRDLASIDNIALAIAVGREILMGVAIGFTANLIFTGITLAGQMMGFQMGFAIVNVIDPFNI